MVLKVGVVAIAVLDGLGGEVGYTRGLYTFDVSKQCFRLVWLGQVSTISVHGPSSWHVSGVRSNGNNNHQSEVLISTTLLLQNNSL